jgi:hypothetical protein
LHFCINFQRFLSDGGRIVAVMEERWTPQRQGDAGELSAMAWLASKGAIVAIPIGHSPDYDLLADFGDELVRVQVKTSTFFCKGRWQVWVSTMGGNESWQGLVRRFHPSRCHRPFVHVGDGRRWYIPATAADGGSQLLVGGPKYAEFEVEPGDPLPARIASEPVSSS